MFCGSVEGPSVEECQRRVFPQLCGGAHAEEAGEGSQSNGQNKKEFSGTATFP